MHAQFGDEHPKVWTKAPWLPGHALSGADYSAIELSGDGHSVYMLNQLELPEHEHYVELKTAHGVERAIQSMVVRGAPAIGIAGAYAMVLACTSVVMADAEKYLETMRLWANTIKLSRPTAVNLSWAVDRMLSESVRHAEHPGETRLAELISLAKAIHLEDVEACRAMGRHGEKLLPERGVVLTHCNAGALATGGYGTALGVIRAAIEAGKAIRVLADETRPYLQGARLTAWELHKDGIPVEVITDSMAGYFMSRGEIDAIFVGADRIARNGDVANKIGTYSLACLAQSHGIPFYVAAPMSTVDAGTADGKGIPIEERNSHEVAFMGRRRLVPEGVGARHPAFDVTPARLIRAIVTERGVFEPAEVGLLSPHFRTEPGISSR